MRFARDTIPLRRCGAEPQKTKIIAMLLEGNSPLVVAQTLRVSVSYVRTIRTMLKNEGTLAGRNVG